ncbi:aminoacyl-histidine dipeptidase [Sedimentibacter sp. zth1]|uniref:aminoacyl-histidine dipeptidase n=1 Tax=Sedimentibacter sp. zth1 TaxID=2816908 RepID=UPI001A932414|nr:aminoacyl-histidine dipeptidase [Sedimentibacter sp. zth1]QSX06988.1 aminoacyl-histidine dipeptidase [Sedimentibacter sp. zth1]
MKNVLEGLKPEKVFYYFEELTKIPHGSKHEKQISDYLFNLCKNKGWEVIQDKALNLIIRKPATKGYENAPMILLQGHMDMVCEKNEGINHDFSKDPLKLRIIDNQIYATETTLGADNGIAVAMIFAIFDSDEIQHPALEALITVDEEMGMTGVQRLDGDMIKAKHLINLDSEEEGILTAGCAGGADIEFKVPSEKVESKLSNTCLIKVSGLAGGHSGGDADKEKGNSNKILARVLFDLLDEIELVSFNGGSKPNAIPREAKAVVKTNNIDSLKQKVDKWDKIIKNEYTFSDANVVITVENTKDEKQVLSKKVAEKIIACINIVPIGVLSKSTVIDLVISSNNLGIVTTDDNYVSINCHPRSSVMSLLTDSFEPSMRQLAKYLNVEYAAGDFYPGWEYAKESEIRDICAETYKEFTGKDAEVVAIHAGLECGYLLKKCKSLVDAISMGPNMEDIHSPNEHLDIGSVERTFNYLCEILKRIK